MAKQSQPAKQNKALAKLIDKYYADLAELARQHVLFEMGTRRAFHRLMADAGKPHRWTLIAEQEKNKRLFGAQDLAWALINSPAFLFNRQ